MGQSSKQILYYLYTDTSEKKQNKTREVYSIFNLYKSKKSKEGLIKGIMSNKSKTLSSSVGLVKKRAYSLKIQDLMKLSGTVYGLCLPTITFTMS